MFVIKRLDSKEVYDTRFRVPHDTLEEAVVEAERLARTHATENAVFEIFEMVSKMKISGDVVVSMTE